MDYGLRYADAADTQDLERSEGAARRRGEITAAAGTLFSADGYERISMARIATESKVSRSEIYRLFGSKGNLYACALDSHAERLLAGAAEAADGGDSDERLRSTVSAFFKFVEEDPAGRRLLFNVPPARAAAARLRREVQGWTVSGITDILVVDRLRARELMAILNGIAVWWEEHPKVRRKAVVNDAVKQIRFGLLERPLRLRAKR